MFQDAELDYDAMLQKVRERRTQPVLRGLTAEARSKLRSNGDGELLDEDDCTPVGSTTSAVVAHITPRYALRHASLCFKPFGLHLLVKEWASASPSLLPGIDHVPCLQEIRSVYQSNGLNSQS